MDVAWLNWVKKGAICKSLCQQKLSGVTGLFVEYGVFSCGLPALSMDQQNVHFHCLVAYLCSSRDAKSLPKLWLGGGRGVYVCVSNCLVNLQDCNLGFHCLTNALQAVSSQHHYSAFVFWNLRLEFYHCTPIMLYLSSCSSQVANNGTNPVTEVG